jgi:hypothetical protein
VRHEIFENYVGGDFETVYLADGSTLDIVRMGDVCVRVQPLSMEVVESWACSITEEEHDLSRTT